MSEPTVPVPPGLSGEDADRFFLGLAVEQARTGWEEGGVPIGAALVHEGRVRRVFAREEASAEAIVTAATGAGPAPVLHRAA